MHPVPLLPEKLRRVCSDDHLDFETTAELVTADGSGPIGAIVGQPRGTRAIEFGIGIQSHGYNVFVLGEQGTGRTTTIKRFLRERTKQEAIPPDWVYVHNFAVPHQPHALPLPPGKGHVFKADMGKLLDSLRKDLPKAFDTDAYRETVAEIERSTEARQEEILNGLQEEATEQSFALVNTASGPMVAPVADDKVIDLETLPVAERQALEKQQSALHDRLDELLYRARQLETDMREEIRALNREVAAGAIKHHFEQWRETYAGLPAILSHLEAFQEDVLDHLEQFMPREDDERRGEPELRRYKVNLFVDNSDIEGAPVVDVSHPTYYNLMGRIEYETRRGTTAPHFTTLKAGSLHRANGGYLVLQARDLRRYRDAWDALKRALKDEEIRLHSLDAIDSSTQVLARSLDPEPIPLQVKVILLGSPDIYYSMYHREEEFRELFKVKAEFDTMMPRDEEHEKEYARFIAGRCQEEGLRHLDRAAVEKVVEYGSRLSGDQNRLSTRLADVGDLVHEANYLAGLAGRDLVIAEDVQRALEERLYRTNQWEERMREQVLEGDIIIAVTGAVVGQVNGLTILDLGDYSFSLPGRITARTYIGEGGVVNIEREVDLAGPFHNKGLLTLVGYLGGTYAQRQPLTLSASLTFEQNYAEIDGDSASAAELYALLSSLSNLPATQAIAVTGSFNQRGDMQAVGGVTEKVEGFYAICEAEGLTGDQGVIIPRANVNNLMLREDVIRAVEEGCFHVWAIDHVDEGIELMLGRKAGTPDAEGGFPEGTVHALVQESLQRLAQAMKAFGELRHEEHEEEE